MWTLSIRSNSAAFLLGVKLPLLQLSLMYFGIQSHLEEAHPQVYTNLVNSNCILLGLKVFDEP